jgi:pyrroloquinoline quinone biosynthesis protein B
MRQGTLRGKARTQSQVALSADGETWFLLNASPDLRVQIEATPELHPKKAPRHTPIAGVVLTSGDLDHVLGLLLLREFQPMRVYGTPSLRKILIDSNSVFRMLFSGPKALAWSDILPNEETELCDVTGRGSGILVNPLPLFGNYPRYTETTMMTDLPAEEAVLGLTMHAGKTTRRSGRFIYAPGLAQVDDSTRTALSSADLLLVDGTFWSEDELCATIGRSASQMGHLPISGAHGTLESLAELSRPKRVFIHVNNTNPILDEDSAEYQQVRAAGWELAEDGMEFNL